MSRTHRRAQDKARIRKEKAAERIGIATEELAAGVSQASAAAEELRRSLEQISSAAEDQQVQPRNLRPQCRRLEQPFSKVASARRRRE